ncbi:M48 family metallopeptidase [Ramlibacter sp. WS9]|uniref:M48 family metallopeptidase n=1 Tax=Ramlibacter sp. WS9 TaxID=1882741 RepID=UPI0011411593|nr:M48 family metallopeptidase [Ramlibacter sp. WS9]ROZ63915.1 peptidase M48 [Ramlibacter sp. WS9]
MEPIRARWFDGRSSRPQDVLVSLHAGLRGPALHLHPLSQPAGELLKLQAGQIDWPETWSAGRAPRTVTVDLRDHGSLEIDGAPQWQAALAAAGERPSLAQRMQTRWSVLLGVSLLAVVALGAFYRWGTPWAATQVTRQVPLDWETSLTADALVDLDKLWFKPSKLPPARQSQLRERFDALARQIEPGMRRYPAYSPQLTLAFRSGFPANALALPGGTIVMTDAIVEAAAAQGVSDDALVGVLAHEIGHVMHRHTTRMLVEQGVLNVGLGLALGDVSVLVSTGGSLLTGLAYQRGHESEADCFAAALMRKAQLPTAPMAELLLGMEAERGAKKPAEAESRWMTLLSSHPDTAARARQLKAGRVEGC